MPKHVYVNLLRHKAFCIFPVLRDKDFRFAGILCFTTCVRAIIIAFWLMSLVLVVSYYSVLAKLCCDNLVIFLIVRIIITANLYCNS